MNRLLRYSISILGAALLVFLVAYAARGEPDGFIIENADENRYASLVGNATLTDLIRQVAPRFVIEYANWNRFASLGPMPTELRTLLGQVAPRFVIQYANWNRFANLGPLPDELLILIGQVAPRFVIQYANWNRFAPLTYPAGLINDTALPVILSTTAEPAGGGQILLQWTTDELTTAFVEYGIQSGNYTGRVDDPNFLTQHEVLFTPELAKGLLVYYRITCTDRSGNVTVSPEYSIEVPVVDQFYLPFILR